MRSERRAPPRPFPRRHTRTDIGLLAEVDALHGTLSGPAARRLCLRARNLFDERRFERLADISNGHLYNLCRTTACQRRRGALPAQTRPAPAAVGERRRPRPFGQPGCVRVDTVHQGDFGGIKGPLPLNLGDRAFRCLARKVDLDLLARLSAADCLGRAGDFGCAATLDWFLALARALGVEHEAPTPLLLGRHLLQLGLTPGPEIGRILKAVYERQLDGEITSPEQAVQAARQIVADGE